MKGQEEAPFEILIGMIIFSFVLLIANYIMESYNQTQIEAKLDMELTNFKNYLEDIAFKAQGTKRTTTLDFSVPSYFGSTKLTHIELKRVTSTECPNPSGTCWAIIVYAKDNLNKNGYEFKKIFTNVPGDIKFNIEIKSKYKIYNCGLNECLKLTKYKVILEKIKDDEVKIILE